MTSRTSTPSDGQDNGLGGVNDDREHGDEERKHRPSPARAKDEEDQDEEDLLWLTRRTLRAEEECEDGEGGDGGKGGGPPGSTATPFLVVPAAAGDAGTRPVPIGQAVANRSIAAEIPVGIPRLPWGQIPIQLSCAVANLGLASCASGLAEFYVGDQFAVWHPGHENLTPAQVRANAQLMGRAAFRAPPSGTVTVSCPRLWILATFNDAQKGVLVQVYDPFTDEFTVPYDAINDRHVARSDDVMDPVLF